MFRFAKTAIAGSVFLLGLLAASTTFGQLKVVKGEKVKVLSLGKWRDGTVLETKGNRSNVEYTFVKLTTDVFTRNNIRKLCEVGALDYARRWESADGNFKIVAALKSGDSEKVTLVKEDLDQITVPLAKLSKRDNAYAKKLLKNQANAAASGAAPAIMPVLPEFTEFGQLQGFGMFKAGSEQATGPFGVTPSFMKFDQNGLGFNFVRPSQKLCAVIPVGGPDQLVLVSAVEDGFFDREKKWQSQLYWLNMATQEVVGNIALNPQHHPIDYDPRTKRLLTLHKKGVFEKTGNYFTLWSLQPGAKKVEPLVSWPVEFDWKIERGLFGFVVNERVVVTKLDKNTYVAFDVEKKKAIYKYISESFFDVPAVLTLDRKSLIVCEDEKVTILDAEKGSITRQFPLKTRGLSGANVNASGTKLAAVNQNRVFVWDLESDDQTPKEYKAPSIASPFRSRVSWINDDLILCDAMHRQVLYRLSLELPVWSYEMDVASKRFHTDPLKNKVINGKCFYFARPGRGKESLVAVGIVDFPGPQVESLTNDIDRDSLDLIRPGSRMAIKIGSGVTDPDRVRNALLKQIEKNEWVHDDSSEFVISAEMGVTSPQTVTYEVISTGRRFNVTFSSHWSTLKLTQGSTVIFQSGTSSGAPSHIRVDNAQDQVNQYQRPNLAFFDRVKMPARVMDPKYANGFGVSKLGLKGIEVVETSPPGRPDDPDAAFKEDEEKRQKEEDENRKRGDAQ